MLVPGSTGLPATAAALVAAVLLDDAWHQGRVVVVQDDGRGGRMQQMGRSGGRSRGTWSRLRYLRNHVARGGRMWRRLTTARLRNLVLEHTVRLATTSRLVFPEARRCRTGLLDLHVAHRASPVVALALLPHLAGLLVAECRRFMAVLAVWTLLTCRVVEEVAVMQISWQVHKWLLLHRCLPRKSSSRSRSESNFCWLCCGGGRNRRLRRRTTAEYPAAKERNVRSRVTPNSLEYRNFLEI